MPRGRWRRTRVPGAVLAAAVVLGVLPTHGARSAVAQEPTRRAAATQHGTKTAADEERARALAEREGEAVEIASLRGESSEVFATPDGKLEAREHLRPVRARVDGAWKPIDTTLATAGGGMVAPKATTVELAFSGGGDEPLVRMVKAGRKMALSWPAALPTPRLQGDTATYPDVLPGVDLRMGAQEDGFTQLLVVKSAEAAASRALAELRLKLDAEGLDVRKADSGGVEAKDKGAGGTVFEAPQPVMWDSSPGAAPSQRKDKSGTKGRTGERTPLDTAGGPDQEPGAGESGKLAPVGVEVPGAQNEMVLRPDTEVLKGKDTVYPVFIDPQWYSPKATAWTMASKYWASSPQWKFNGDSDGGLGYCGWNYCKPEDTKRLFYRIPTSRFAGKSVLSAEFVVRNTWSASCSDRGVELWRTKGISSSTTWNSQNSSGFWADHLATESFAHGFDGCSAKDAEFSVKSAVQQAADKKWPTMTFGLKASSESDRYGWKRFSDDAYLRVKYNRPPGQIRMSQLTMEYGGVCKKPGDAPRVRTLGKIYANHITDPDGDRVAVQFQAAWDNGDGKGVVARWKPGLTSSKRSGSEFRVSLPSSIPSNKAVDWYVRSYDGAQYSPWSTAGDPTGCYFIHDTSVPKAPAVGSGEYPSSDPEDPDDPWLDGVGQYGTFTFDSSSADVTRYRWGVNSDPVSANQTATSGGASRSVKVLPAKPGLNFLTAQAFDQAGNGSEIRTYQFRVKAGQPERATWQLDEPAGAARSEGSTPPRTLALHGGAETGAEGVAGKGLALNGTDGYASTDLSVVDSTRGFSVSTWVKLAEVPDHTAMVASQIGNETAGYELYYSATYQRWVFNTFADDKADATVVRAMAPAPGGVQAGVWTHLVGTYDSVDGKLQLFVNDKLVGSASHQIDWNARRGLQLGAGASQGKPKNFLPGTIDETQVFDKPVAQDEVHTLYTRQTVGDPGRPALAVFPLDEDTGATEVRGHGGVIPATYSGGATTGAAGVAGKAAHFNGTDGYARIGRDRAPHINSSRSFTVSAWAKLDRTPDGTAVITAQGGEHAPGFELYYSKTYDRWAVNQYSADTTNANPIRAMQPDGTTARAGEWVHLAGVHDTVADTLTLYVNGTRAGSTRLAGAFYADRAMTIGAGTYDGNVGNHFPGTIDDVRLFDRPVSAGEVQQLFKQRALVKGRWTFEKTSGTSGSPLTTPDASASGNTMTLHGGAKVGPGWVDGGVSLDGIDDHATTSTVPVDTSASFTVTAWAQAAAVPKNGVTLLSAPGAQRDAFAVRYVPGADPDSDPGRWRIAMPAADKNDADLAQAENSQFSGATDWTHLALVYDGFAKQLKLYVNGELQEDACPDADGDGEADDSGCADQISWAENALSFKATQPLQLGRAKAGNGWGEYWPGAVSDLWAFQGALTDEQIDRLAAGFPGVPTDVPDGG
ncbi:LamG-like jellyroll fold domain-containing protein [Streptomyces cucumeris]|uniref:LamG-like jellyroll fold domain-containing protein n=1 Tax=Streptomyces cucumeris TaxID=2962890 RepID=UPI003EBF8A26